MASARKGRRKKAANTISKQEIMRVAKERLGFRSLRPGQLDALESVLAARDTLVIMPTGAGKSAIYQIAAFLIKGPTVVISPLIALQRDQAKSLEEQDVGDAVVVNSTNRKSERIGALDDLKNGNLEFLFLAPEQLSSEELIERIQSAKCRFFVVDEAHCISEWGHDFRPDYLRLGAIIDALNHPTVLALTATASSPVREEIATRLNMRNPRLIIHGFDRPNIRLGRKIFKTEQEKLDALIVEVENQEKPGIVYVSTRKHAENVTEALQQHGVSAVCYHAGMNAKDRTAVQESFLSGEDDVIVATSAFGMGVDKPGVRFVFHYDISDSVDSYYQEIGRAGRDGRPARAILFYRPADINIHKFFAGGGKIGQEQVEQVAGIVHESGGAHADEIQEETGLSESKLMKVLNRLEEVGGVDILPTGEVAPNPDQSAEPEKLTEAAKQALRAERLYRDFQEARLELIQGYAETGSCLRKYLLNYFGEKFDQPCGYCSNCETGLQENEPEKNAREPFPVKSRVNHQSLGEGIVMRYEDDKVVVLFDNSGYKTLSVDYVLSRKLLAPA